MRKRNSGLTRIALNAIAPRIRRLICNTTTLSAGFLGVVDAQRIALQAEREEAQPHGWRAVSTIPLAKALGEGWPL
jgi:hypothetical protein